MCGNRDRFKDYVELETPIEIILGDDRSVMAYGKGSMDILNDRGETITLSKVLYVPTLTTGLFSIGAALDAGARDLNFTTKTCSMTLQGDNMIIGGRLGKLYKVKLPSLEKANVAAT